MNFTEILNKAVVYFNGQGILLQVFLVVLFTSIVHYIETIVYKRLMRKTKGTKTHWDEAILHAIHKPLGILIWFLGISYSIDILRMEKNGAAIYHATEPLRQMAVIAILVWFLLRLIKQIEWVYIETEKGLHTNVDKTTVNALSQVLRAAVIVTSILVAMQTFGYSISGILTLGGVGGLVAGLAAKDLLANFFGGIMIYMDRPFKVGDWIRSPDRDIEGTVEYIGWRLCRIRTFDKRPLFVPNAIFSTIAVENPSRMLNRRIKTNVGVRYDDATKVGDIIHDVKNMLHNHPEIDATSTLIVNLVEFGPSSLNFMVYTFTKTTNWIKFQEVQQDVFLQIIQIIHGHGADCAFPTTTVHIPEGLAINQTMPDDPEPSTMATVYGEK